MGFCFRLLLETTRFQFKSKLLLPKNRTKHTPFKSIQKRETNFSNGCECNKYLWSWCGNHINYPLFSSRLLFCFSTLLSFSVSSASWSHCLYTSLFVYWAHFIHNCLLLLLVLLYVHEACFFHSFVLFLPIFSITSNRFTVSEIQCNDIRL